MMHDDSRSEEDKVLDLALACDDALASGLAPESAHDETAPAEVKRLLDCMRLLRRAWSTDDAANTNLLHRAWAATSSPDTNPEFDTALSVTSPAYGGSPRHIGRFLLRRELGRGGFGIVFLAYDPQLHRDVALKVPRANAFLDPKLRSRFQQEARAAAGLDHPNIIQVHETGEDGALCYLVSAYCPGVTLAEWLRSRHESVPCREAAQLVATLAKAVEHAHQRGVLHRDLKPGNILLQEVGSKHNAVDSRTNVPVEATTMDSGASTDCGLLSSVYSPKITDFGLAKFLDGAQGDEGHHTQSGAALGTPHYMAPEQTGGARREIGPATDVYALGVLLYERPAIAVPATPVSTSPPGSRRAGPAQPAPRLST